MNEPHSADWRWDAPYHAAAHVAAWCGVFWFLYFDIARHKLIFMEFGTELSGGVMLLMQASDIVINYWYVHVVALVIFAAIDTTACFAFKNAVSQWLWTAAMLVIPLAVLVIGKVALSAAIQKLQHDLSAVWPSEWIGWISGMG